MFSFTRMENDAKLIFLLHLQSLVWFTRRMKKEEKTKKEGIMV